MKQRFLSLFLVLVMICSFALTSCSSERTEEEIIADIVGSGTTALTLTLRIPTNADTTDTAFQERLKAVEDAINAYLTKRNDYTKVQLIAVSTSDYDTELASAFASAKAKTTAENKPLVVASKYVNQPVKNELDMWELKYPTVLENQIDIVYISGFEQYKTYASAGYLQQIDSYIESNGAYSNLNKMITSNVLSAMKFNSTSLKGTYAIPNNHLYAVNAQAQLMLIKKDIFDATSFDITSINDFVSCVPYIQAVGLANDPNVIPLVATEGEGLSLNSDSTTLSADYVAYKTAYDTLNDAGYVQATKGEEVAAVSFAYGNLDDMASYEEDYYVIVNNVAEIDMEGLYQSMFAVSTYSCDYNRAMKVIYLLESNEDLITMLQYGIENADYKINYDDYDNGFLAIQNTKYDMKGLNLGNQYFTYTGNGCSTDSESNIWKDVKAYNYKLHGFTAVALQRNGEASADAITKSENIEKINLKQYADETELNTLLTELGFVQ